MKLSAKKQDEELPENVIDAREFGDDSGLSRGINIQGYRGGILLAEYSLALFPSPLKA